MVFIDDSPGFTTSAFQHAPDVHLIHFLHDERYARLVPPLDFVSLRTHTWEEVHPHVMELIAGRSAQLNSALNCRHEHAPGHPRILP